MPPQCFNHITSSWIYISEAIIIILHQVMASEKCLRNGNMSNVTPQRLTGIAGIPDNRFI